MRAGAVGLGDTGLDRLGPAGHAGCRVHHEGLAAGVPAAARAEEEAHLDVAVVSDRRHLVELGVGEHHDPRALGHAVDADALGVGLGEDGAKHDRALHARDLEVVATAVREAARRLRPGPRRRLEAGRRKHLRVARARAVCGVGRARHRASLVWFT